MCRPSSSAESADVPQVQQFILQHTALLGPAAACFVRSLWSQAARQAYHQSLDLLAYAQRYSPHRLERACQRALLYDLDSPQALRLILAESLDLLPAHPAADVAGQLLLPFPDLAR
jgi:hypothetical protein